MRLNWQIRFKNPHFLAQLALAVLTPALAYKGISGADLTTWGAVWELIKDAFSNPYILALIGVSVFNAVTDPTTKGVSDSHRALTYYRPGGERR